MIGETIQVIGKSSRGKNRIHENGNRWKIIDEGESVQCCEYSPAVLLESIETQYHRWMSLSGDSDFEKVNIPNPSKEA